MSIRPKVYISIIRSCDPSIVTGVSARGRSLVTCKYLVGLDLRVLEIKS